MSAAPGAPAPEVKPLGPCPQCGRSLVHAYQCPGCGVPVWCVPPPSGPTPAMIEAAAQGLYEWQCSPYLGPFKKLRELDDYQGRLIDAEYMLRAALTAPEP